MRKHIRSYIQFLPSTFSEQNRIENLELWGLKNTALEEIIDIHNNQNDLFSVTTFDNPDHHEKKADELVKKPKKGNGCLNTKQINSVYEC